MALVGGNRNNAGLCGPATVNLNNPLSNANTNIGAALSNLMQNLNRLLSVPYRLVKIKPPLEGPSRHRRKASRP